MNKDLSGFKSTQVNNTNNIVSIPSGAKSPHSAITKHYDSVQDFTGGKTVREWLSTKSFEEQFDYGVKLLQEYGDIIPTDKGGVFVPDDEKIEAKVPLDKGNAEEKSVAQTRWEEKLAEAREDGGVSGQEMRSATLDLISEGVPRDEAVELYKSRNKDKNVDDWLRSGGDLDEYFGFLDVRPKGQAATAEWMNRTGSLSESEKWKLWQIAKWSSKKYKDLIK